MLELSLLLRLFLAGRPFRERHDAVAQQMGDLAPRRAGDLITRAPVKIFARLRDRLDHRRQEERSEQQRDDAAAETAGNHPYQARARQEEDVGKRQSDHVQRRLRVAAQRDQNQCRRQ
jgi:hypothetical protein